LPKSILRNAKQDENPQTDTPIPDCAQIRASARAHHHASLRGLINPPEHLGIVSATISSRQEDVPTKTKKTVSWDTELTVGYFSQDSPEEEIQKHRQVCIDQEEVRSNLNPVTYVMSSICGIDHSVKEFFYQAYCSNPIASNTINQEGEDDIYD
jgi:hypothetical protein